MKDTHLTCMRTDDEVEHEHEAQEVVQHEVDHHQHIVRPESARNRSALMKILTSQFPTRMHIYMYMYECTYIIHNIHIYIYIYTYIHRHRNTDTGKDTDTDKHTHMQAHAPALGPVFENVYRRGALQGHIVLVNQGYIRDIQYTRTYPGHINDKPLTSMMPRRTYHCFSDSIFVIYIYIYIYI